MIQSMLLAAWGDVVGSNWVGFGGLERVKAVLDLPAGVDVLAILPLTTRLAPVGRDKKRRKAPLAVSHLERYGRSFA